MSLWMTAASSPGMVNFLRSSIFPLFYVAFPLFLCVRHVCQRRFSRTGPAFISNAPLFAVDLHDGRREMGHMKGDNRRLTPSPSPSTDKLISCITTGAYLFPFHPVFVSFRELIRPSRGANPRPCG